MREFRVGHDGRRIGIHQHDFVPFRAQRLARLRTGVIKLASLADNDRAGPDDENFLDVFTFRQVPSSPFLVANSVQLPSSARTISYHCTPLRPSTLSTCSR